MSFWMTPTKRVEPYSRATKHLTFSRQVSCSNPCGDQRSSQTCSGLPDSYQATAGLFFFFLSLLPLITPSIYVAIATFYPPFHVAVSSPYSHPLMSLYSLLTPVLLCHYSHFYPYPFMLLQPLLIPSFYVFLYVALSTSYPIFYVSVFTSYTTLLVAVPSSFPILLCRYIQSYRIFVCFCNCVLPHPFPLSVRRLS